MSNIDKQALREAADAANETSWGLWESYHPHKGARGYEVKVGVKAIAQHCLKVDSVFIAAANPATVLALLDELEAAENNLIDSECHVAELEESLRDKQALLEAAEKRIAELREWNAGLAQESCERQQRIIELEQKCENDPHIHEIIDLKERIAELEARTVKLPGPISVLHRRDFNDAHRAIYAYPEAEVDAALAAAGIGKGE